MNKRALNEDAAQRERDCGLAADNGRTRGAGERRERHEQRRSKFKIKSPNDFSFELQCGKQDLNLHELSVH